MAGGLVKDFKVVPLVRFPVGEDNSDVVVHIKPTMLATDDRELDGVVEDVWCCRCADDLTHKGLAACWHGGEVVLHYEHLHWGVARVKDGYL